MKVIAAMQKNRVSAECFNISSGYGYNDMGRDTLERVYADCFGGKMRWSVHRSPVEPMHLRSL